MLNFSTRSLKTIQQTASMLHSCENSLHDLIHALYTADRAKTQAAIAMADFQASKALQNLRKLDATISKEPLA